MLGDTVCGQRNKPGPARSADQPGTPADGVTTNQALHTFFIGGTVTMMAQRLSGPLTYSR